MTFAPIIIFSYNRPNHLKKTIDALSKNEFADKSTLFIFCDGAKENATAEQQVIVRDNIEVARNATGFKELHVIVREKNYGLANNIIDAITVTVNRYGKVITLEDDVITSVGFLKFMNEALDMYINDLRVMHISGYMYPHKEKLPDIFFYELPYPGGGWATWKRAWQYFSNDIDALYSYWSQRWREFNKVGDHYLQEQLEANKNGSLYTWFIKWHAVVLKMKGLTLYPGISLTNNIGFDGSGVNSGELSKFDIKDPADYIPIKRIKVRENKKAAHIIKRFYSGHWYSKRYRNRWIARFKRFLSIG